MGLQGTEFRHGIPREFIGKMCLRIGGGATDARRFSGSQVVIDEWALVYAPPSERRLGSLR
jgi:hypothetical protein